MGLRSAGIFSGIGMLERAAEMLGFETAWMCENEPYCRQVLAKRFPGVAVYEDVKDLDGSALLAEHGHLDLFVFGFPCQDISGAGRGAGLHGERSGLWREGARLIGELRPKMVLIENVRNLISKRPGMDVVLSDLIELGYVVDWDVIPAAAVGACHLRERVWIVARLPELARVPVFGFPEIQRKTGKVKTFSLDEKLPRSGQVGFGRMTEMQTIAPRKTKRSEGWSYWTGVNLCGDAMYQGMWPTLHGLPKREYARYQGPSGNELGKRVNQVERWDMEEPRMLWPSSSSRDWKDTGDLNCVDDKGLLPRRVFHVGQGTALLPTPDAYGNGNDPVNHMQKKEDRCGGPRNTITNLDVIARNGFAQPNGRLWPTTTTTDARNTRNESAVRPSARLGDSRGAQGKRFFNPERSVDLDDAVAARGCAGSLNPDWVEWLMAIPLGWTDLSLPNEMLTQCAWSYEPVDVPRVATGIKHRSPRLKSIGNSIVWPCAYIALSRALVVTPLLQPDSINAG